MKKIGLLLFLLSSVSAVFSQARYLNFKLKDDVTFTDKSHIKDEHAIILNEHYALEFTEEDDINYTYTLLHRRVQLLTDKGVNGFNTLYIPVNGNHELIAYDARVITPSGKIIRFDNPLNEAFDEKSKRKYKYFAFEGIEKGCDIEYFYYTKRAEQNALLGRSINIQKNFLIERNLFEIIAPQNLEIGFKTYNQLPEVVFDSSLENKNRWVLETNNMPKFQKQNHAFEQANQQYVSFKLAHNYDSGSPIAVSYSRIAPMLFTNIFASNTKEEIKALKKILKKLPLKSGNTEKKIRVIEDYIKSTYAFADIDNPQLEEISSILTNKTVNEYGAMRLMGAMLSLQKINTELVITSNRSEVPFDPEFESYASLNKRLLYFPEVGKFLDPFNPMLRLGYVDPMFMNTHGLFIRAERKKKNLEIHQHSGFIAPLITNATTSNIYVNVAFNSEFDDIDYQVTHSQSGYYANTYQCGFDFIKEEDRKMWSELSLKTIDDQAEITNLIVENKGCENFGVKPFTAHGTLKTDKFLLAAGNKYLFRIGELIGPQMELYQEEERILPVQSDYKRKYHRKIQFNIPEGYKITNLADLNIYQAQKGEGENNIAFHSRYTQLNDKIEVEIDEYYNKIDFSKEEFEIYRNVINAAADFNKVVLIFQPE